MPKRKAAAYSEEDYSQSSSSEDNLNEPPDYTAHSRRSIKKRKHRVQVVEARDPNSSVAQHPDPRTFRSGHSKNCHVFTNLSDIRTALLNWYSSVHALRQMPWRKPFDSSLNPQERSQRAYEVWTSEIMLQQTQVATVIPYYHKWMTKFPTVEELAAASVDEVNAVWKGLGYYSRASRLLSGAQKVVQDYGGLLPTNAHDMQANIPGIGRYSAGAICSIAYGERVPVLDGNVHRLLSRMLRLHSPPKAKATLDLLWSAAEQLVQKDDTLHGQVAAGDHSSAFTGQHAGDINQALIELGSTICKVRTPSCDSCPLSAWCGAYNLLGVKNTRVSLGVPPGDIEDCDLCLPVPDGHGVTAYPMKVVKKKSREETDLVNIVEWRSGDARYFLLVRRPEGGLLGGLTEFPCVENIGPVMTSAREQELSQQLLAEWIETSIPSTRSSSVTAGPLQVRHAQPIGNIMHVFSHIKKTYQVQWILLEGGEHLPTLFTRPTKPKLSKCKRKTTSHPVSGRPSNWVLHKDVGNENIGTGVLKMWKLFQQSPYNQPCSA